jgi:peptidyl-prolyl cis-trans isomerase SurA
MREQIQEQIYTQKVQPALREYLTKLREEAYIDIKPGYTDSGASSKQTNLIYTSDTGPKTKQVRGKLGVGKKKTIVVVGSDKKDRSKVTGSTSELGLAKAEVDAKTKAENDRKAAEQAAAAKAAADAAEKEKLSHMKPKERKKYLAQKKSEAKKEAKQESKENRKEKKLARKQAKHKPQEAKDDKNGKKKPEVAPAESEKQADADATPPKKKKSISWF